MDTFCAWQEPVPKVIATSLFIEKEREIYYLLQVPAMAIFGQVCHDLGSSFPWGGVGGQVEVGIEEERRKTSRLLSFFKVMH